MNRKIFAVLALVLVFAFSGCSLFSKNSPAKNNINTGNTSVSKQDISTKPDVETEASKSDDEKSAVESKTLTLYFINSDSDMLVAEKRTVDVNKGDALDKVIFEQLAKGPDTSGLFPVVPKDTKVLSVETKDGLCKLNLSQEFIKNNNTGSAGEAVTIYSIVNTLTSLPDVKKVQFLVNGQVCETFGQMELSEPLERNDSMIKE